MTETPLISICITAFNRAHHLPKVLESIYNLDYPKRQVQLVFHDDGSSDRTYDVFHDFAEKHKNEYNNVVLTRTEPTGEHYNIPRARNKCLSHVKGHAFFVDSDVIVPPEALKLLLEQFKNPKVGEACIPYAYTEEELAAPVRPAEVNIHLGCTLLRDQLLAAIGKLDERFLGTDDFWLYFKAKKLGYKMGIVKNKRCFHMNPRYFSRHLKGKIVNTPKWHLLLFREKLADWELARRYLYYYGILGFAALAILTFTLFPTNLIYGTPLLLALAILVAGGAYHYRSLMRFLIWGLPTGICLCIGLILATLNPKSWR